MKLRRVEVSETVGGLFYCIRFAEVTWEALSIVGLILSCIRHVRRDVDQTNDRWIRSRFGDDGAAIAVSDKNAGSILLSEHALRSSDIVFKGGLRFLNDADVISIP